MCKYIYQSTNVSGGLGVFIRVWLMRPPGSMTNRLALLQVQAVGFPPYLLGTPMFLHPGREQHHEHRYTDYSNEHNSPVTVEIAGSPAISLRPPRINRVK